MRVEDDGIGLPIGLERHQVSLGMRLVRQLARQLHGTIETVSDADGTHVSIRSVSHPVPQLDLFEGRKTFRMPGKSSRTSSA